MGVNEHAQWGVWGGLSLAWKFLGDSAWLNHNLIRFLLPPLPLLPAPSAPAFFLSFFSFHFCFVAVRTVQTRPPASQIFEL